MTTKINQPNLRHGEWEAELEGRDYLVALHGEPAKLKTDDLLGLHWHLLDTVADEAGCAFLTEVIAEIATRDPDPLYDERKWDPVIAVDDYGIPVDQGICKDFEI